MVGTMPSHNISTYYFFVTDSNLLRSKHLQFPDEMVYFHIAKVDFFDQEIAGEGESLIERLICDCV